MDPAYRKLTDRLGRLERDVRDLARASQAGHRSVEGRSFEVHDDDGVLRGRFGEQADGTYTFRIFNGPPPPKPEAPTVQPIGGGMLVSWSGLFEPNDDAAPEDFAYVAVHASQTTGFTPSPDTLRSSIPNPYGGAAAVAVPPGDYYVVLVAVSDSGVESVKSTEMKVSAGTGGVEVLNDLLDVIVDDTTAQNRQVLAFSTTDNQWHAYGPIVRHGTTTPPTPASDYAWQFYIRHS